MINRADEIGCPSGCGGLSDIFINSVNTKTFILKESSRKMVSKKSCLWRIRAPFGERILVTIERCEEDQQISNSSVR